MSIDRKLVIPVSLAAILWFMMFSPWTSHIASFWLMMGISGTILLSLAFAFDCKGMLNAMKGSNPLAQLILGMGIAVCMWGIFWTGDQIAHFLFPFARPQVNAVYDMKTGVSPTIISALLLLLVGPAEELFWRGYVQRRMETASASCRNPKMVSFLVTAAIYTLVHVWSFNFMLVMAALVAGAVWGLIYMFKPSWLPALVVSHALWDAAVFVWFPIQY